MMSPLLVLALSSRNEPLCTRMSPAPVLTCALRASMADRTMSPAPLVISASPPRFLATTSPCPSVQRVLPVTRSITTSPCPVFSLIQSPLASDILTSPEPADNSIRPASVRAFMSPCPASRWIRPESSVSRVSPLSTPRFRSTSASPDTCRSPLLNRARIVRRADGTSMVSVWWESFWLSMLRMRMVSSS